MSTAARTLTTVLASALLMTAGAATASAAPAAAQQNCFNHTGPRYAQWAVYKAYNFGDGGYCIQGTNNLRLVYQADGNLVFYDGSRVLWASDTAGRGATRLALQTDGNVVVYNAAGTALWASNHYAHSPSGTTTFKLTAIYELSNAGDLPALNEVQAAPSATVWNLVA